MGWEPLRLAASTAGSEYGEHTLRVAELLGKMSQGPGRADRPAVVWVYDPADEPANSSCESRIFANETVGLALKMFRCFRVDLESVRDERIREEYRKSAPSFHFFDPAGEELSVLSGRKATSLSAFSDHMERAWAGTFSGSFKTYAKDMKRILDRLDKLDGRKQVLAQDRARLADRPNPRKERDLEREEQDLVRTEEEILSDEREVRDRVELRPEFRGDESAALDR